MDKENKESLKKVKEQIEEIIDDIVEEKIQPENVDYLYRLVDIHKDLANEEYWEVKKEDIKMRYRNYSDGSYGRNYSEYGNEVPGAGNYRRGRYSARGYDTKYRGEEMMNEMMYHYGNYSEGREQYVADNETLKSFEYMLKSFKDYYKHLKKEASSQQEIQMLEDTAREMLDM